MNASNQRPHTRARVPLPLTPAMPPAYLPAIARDGDDEGVLPPFSDILPDGEAILQPPMDNTPNDAPPDPPIRIPHLGHALLFLAITGFLLLLTQTAALFAGHPAHRIPSTLGIAPRLLLTAEATSYLLSLTAAWFIFPLLWQRPFLAGLQWNAPAALRNAWKLIPLGFALSFIIQLASSLVTVPKDIPMDEFFRTPADIWLVTAFGTLLAPAFEEVAFRGFLLPAFAIAYDWLSLQRTEAAREAWQSSNALSTPALVFSAVVTSILFALLHGKQTAFTWPVLALLFLVSLVLTLVRIRLRSVAASALVHASYNFAVFLTAFIATGGYRHLDRLPK